MDFEFSDEFLQMAGRVTLADFFTADAVEDRTLEQLMRCVVFARQNIMNSDADSEHEMQLAQRLSRLRNLSPHNWVTHCMKAPYQKKPGYAPLATAEPEEQLPELTQPEAKGILVQWFESKNLDKFRRADALAVVHAAGPFADTDVKIRNCTDNALKLLKDQGILINLPSQPGTWLVQAKFHLQEVA